MRRHLNAGHKLGSVVRLFSIGVCLLLFTPLSAQEPKPRAKLEGHTKSVLSLAFSPDGKTLASGSADKTIRLWDIATGKTTTTLKGAEYCFESVAFSPDGKTLASGDVFNLLVWNLATGKSTTFEDEGASQYTIHTFAFSPDGKTLASGGCCFCKIKLWDLASGKNIRTLDGYDNWGIRAMAFTPDGKTLASMGFNDGIKLWDVVTGKNKAPWKSENHIHSSAFSPNCQTLATAHSEEAEEVDGQRVVKKPACIKLREVSSGKELITLKGQDSVTSITFSPDGKMLASGAEDKTMKMWEVSSGKELATFKGHKDTVTSLAFSPDGKILASAARGELIIDKTINLWDVPTDK